MLLLTGGLAVALAAIHLFGARLLSFGVRPRSRWLSFAGGVAVAYVFLHILPELSVHQQTFAKDLGLGEKEAETWVYLLTLTGLSAAYGLERFAKVARDQRRARNARDIAQVFWLHIGAFAIYNVLIGYLLLHRETTGFWSLVFYFTAMALHFLINDFGLRRDHQQRYHDWGRWVLAAAALLGWALGAVISVSATIIGFLFAFLAGGVVLNVLKEELPEERESRFLPFAFGAAGYAALLIIAS